MKFKLTVDHVYTARYTIEIETKQEDENYLSEVYDGDIIKGDIDDFIEHIEKLGDKVISNTCETSSDECDVSEIFDVE